MSMRGSGGEENSLDTSSGVEVRVTEDVSRHSTSPVPTVTAQKCFVSPLLRIFSSKEVVPRILEYEKALLVMKEHDYAKAPERPEVLKLSSLLIDPPLLRKDSRQSVDAMADMNTLMNTRKDLLQFRESSSKDSVVSSHLRDMVGMQIELIREQQEQLHAKDKELNTVRKDKEQVRTATKSRKPVGNFPFRPYRISQLSNMVKISFITKHQNANGSIHTNPFPSSISASCSIGAYGKKTCNLTETLTFQIRPIRIRFPSSAKHIP